MSVAVFAKHPPYDDGHLGRVAADMNVAGIPIIRVMEFDGAFIALEGSHRISLAHRYGMEPRLVVEIADSCAVPDSVLYRVKMTLPRYEFQHAWVLRLGDVK